jgi:branched-chain amino acid transport system ATP-binding protein
MKLLEVKGLHAHYGKSHILHGIDLEVPEASVVSLLGRNGSGRSTLLKAIMGLVPPSGGTVRLDGVQLAGQRPFDICRQGIGYVPEERLVFPNLTVEENLTMGVQKGASGAHRWSVEEMYDYFPRLKERRAIRAGYLSGGEQQMLTICRSLLGNPRVMLIDEPTEGLAPKIVEVVMEVILDIGRRGGAGRAEANDCSQGRPAGDGHGSWRARLRRHARRAGCSSRNTAQLAGSGLR